MARQGGVYVSVALYRSTKGLIRFTGCGGKGKSRCRLGAGVRPILFQTLVMVLRLHSAMSFKWLAFNSNVSRETRERVVQIDRYLVSESAYQRPQVGHLAVRLISSSRSMVPWPSVMVTPVPARW